MMHFHVFPAGPMCSLRRALLLWFIPVFLLVGAGAASVSYWTYNSMVGTFMDDQMSLLGDSLSAREETLPLPDITRERVLKWGTYVIQVHGADGKLLSTSWSGANLPLQAATGFQDIQHNGLAWRLYTAPIHEGGARQQIQVAQSIMFRHHLAAERAGVAIVPVIVLLGLSMFILWGVAGAVSSAVREIGQQAAGQDEHTITELSLTRVPEEIAPLVISFNSLLTRLRDAFATQRRFVQDAAHELRTPIAAIGLQLENLRADVCTGDAAGRFAQLEAGVHRAQRLVDQLMRLSRHETSRNEVVASSVDLQALVHESINGLIVLADQRNIDLGLVADAPGVGKMSVTCHPADLRSALDNLIDNALRYTPQGGVIDVRLLQENGAPVIEVVDTGPGIPDELLPRVFDRFFRVPGTEVRGSGLGLAIARAAAQRCGLRISLRNRTDRSGLIARIDAA